MRRYERVARRNVRKRSRVDDDRVDGSDVDDGDTAVYMVDSQVEGAREMSGDYDEIDLNKAVQTDLTSTYINELEENAVLIDSTNRCISAEVEKKCSRKVRKRRVF